MVACPHEVENTKPIGEVAGTHIDQAFLGSCANAKYEDLVIAAAILKGRKIHPGVRLIVTPGSKQILLEAMNSGVLQTLIESGDRKSTRLNSSHSGESRMPSSA